MIIVLSSCVHLDEETSDDQEVEVFLTNEVVYKFLDPVNIEKPVDMLQKIEGRYGDTEFSLLIYVKADSDKSEMIILNDFASELARITYSEGRALASGLVAEAGLSAEYIMADFQLAYFKARIISNSLSASGLSFTEYSEGDKIVREILDGKKLIIHIEKNTDSLYFNNILRDYSYLITYGESE
ncbi:MAG: DUF3261 domain-containing protein [Spirochaetales bacterium]|nr:DUF3261 domain-containing protein [Spirochaetales bacterium]